MFHPEDKKFLCKTVTFMSSVLMAGQHLYNPVEHNFRDFWSWNIAPNNPFYSFKQQLLETGKKIHMSNMDSYEVSALCALLFVASGTCTTQAQTFILMTSLARRHYQSFITDREAITSTIYWVQFKYYLKCTLMDLCSGIRALSKQLLAFLLYNTTRSLIYRQNINVF